MEQRHRVDPVVFRRFRQFGHASTEVRHASGFQALGREPRRVPLRLSVVRDRLEGLDRQAGVANRPEAPRIAAGAGLTVRAPASSAKG